MRLTLLNLFLSASAVFATPVFIGTNAKNIYLTDFDAKTGKLTEPVAVGDYGGPGWIAFHPTKPILYVAGKANTPFADKTGAVAAFSIGKDNKLTFLNEASSMGSDPCHLAIDATGKMLVVANYSDGKVGVLTIAADGSLTSKTATVPDIGLGPTGLEKSPHSHAAYFSKSNEYLFEPDLGQDAVAVFKHDQEHNQLDFTGKLKAAAGAGPRHMAFSADEKNAYVINEIDNTIQVSSYDGKGGFTAIQTVPTLPADFTGKNTTAEVEVHANGKFVYGSNRGHDSIAVYSRAGDGKLTLIQHAPAGGKGPRHFKIDPSGKWMLVGHQDSNGISVLALDPATGKLGAIGSDFVSEPDLFVVCEVKGKAHADAPVAERKREHRRAPLR